MQRGKYCQTIKQVTVLHNYQNFGLTCPGEYVFNKGTTSVVLTSFTPEEGTSPLVLCPKTKTSSGYFFAGNQKHSLHVFMKRRKTALTDSAERICNWYKSTPTVHPGG
jgi:hypothetical protein